MKRFLEAVEFDDLGFQHENNLLGNVGRAVAAALGVDGRRYEEARPRLFETYVERLGEIIDGERAKLFRAAFVARKDAENRFLLAQGGWGRAALDRLEATARQRDLELSENPFPPECLGCPKVEGW